MTGRPDSDPYVQSQKMTHKKMEHQFKLSLIRECIIYGKTYVETEAYFKSKGLRLGETQWKALRKELKSAKSAKNWFSKEALYVIEEDHMISVERTRAFEDKLVNIANDLIEQNKFKTVADFTTDKSGMVAVKVKNYNTELFLKIVAEFKSFQETKTKMFSATPLVQEMMEVHARREEEENLPVIPPDTTKHGEEKIVTSSMPKQNTTGEK